MAVSSARCIALMLHVVYKGRALPLARPVRPGKKGHPPEALHVAVVEQIQGLIPPGHRWYCLAMANSMGRACNKRCTRQTGTTYAGQAAI